MNRKNNCNRVFVDKGYLPSMYSWSPGCPDFTKKKRTQNINNSNHSRILYCSAIAGSQGEDWFTTYVYSLGFVNNIQSHFAYVECDYVE